MIKFSTTRSKKKKHDKIILLVKSKLSIIETLASQALVNMEICHEEFITILNEKDEHEKMNENLWNINGKLEEKMRLNSVSLRSEKQYYGWFTQVVILAGTKICRFKKKIIFFLLFIKCLKLLSKDLLKTVFMQ